MSDKPKLNNKGSISMIAGLAAAVVSALVLGNLMSGLSSANKLQKQGNSSGEVAIMKTQIQGLLADPAVCRSVMKDSSGNTPKFGPSTGGAVSNQGDTINRIDYNGLIIAGPKSAFSTLTNQLLALTEADVSLRQDITFNSMPARNYKALLTVTMNRASFAGDVTERLAFPLSITTNNVPSSRDYRKILACSSVFDMGRQIAGQGTIGTDIQTFTNPGTFNFTVPQGVSLLKVEV